MHSSIAAVVCRSQATSPIPQGGNNAHNQDSPTRWFDWTLTDSNHELVL
jgi:pullulanase/glycogen debranching enzyme